MTRTQASLSVIAVTLATVTTLFLLPYTPKIPVKTAVIQRGNWTKTTLAEGVVQYRQQQPAVCLQGGVLRQICAGEGEAVRKGQLLFALDTRQEEDALERLAAGRHAMEEAVSAFGQEAALWKLSERLEMESQEAALKQSIALKQIRAEQDGVMGPVYRQEGELLKAGDVLAVVHSTEKNVAAVCRSSVVSRIGTGAEAAILDPAGQVVGQASLTAIGAPETDASTGQSVQRLVFEPETALTAEPGQRCVVELVQESRRNVPLVPPEAVDGDGCLWLVENGTVSRYPLEEPDCAGQMVQVPEELLGKSAALDPEESRLTPGCPVKEVPAS